MKKSFCSFPKQVKYIYNSTTVEIKPYLSISSNKQKYNGHYINGVHSLTSNCSNLIHSEYTSVIVDNLPIKNAKIIGQHSVFINDKYYAPIEKDLVQDLIVNSKISKGIIKADLIWAYVGKKIKLVPIGGSVYNKIVNYDRRRSLPRIKKTDLKVGHIYTTPGGRERLFLGLINTYIRQWDHASRSDKFIHVKNKPLFYTSWKGYDKKIVADDINKWGLTISEQLSLAEDVGTVKVDKDIVAQIRNSARKSIKDYMSQISQDTYAPHQDIGSAIMSHYKYNCLCIEICKANEGVDRFDIDKYITFS